MKNLFIYPSKNKQNTISKNPYIEDLCDSSSNWFKVIDYNNTNSIGVINIFIKIKQIDILWLNWIEDLPERKLGLLQSFFYLIFIFVNKFTQKKIIFTVHNKVSHSPKYYKIKKMLQYITIKNSTLVITHSSDGLTYIKSIINKNSQAHLLYIPHPTKLAYNYNDADSINYKYDILIWGTICKYKGISEFLEFIYDKNLQNKYKIKIVGKVVDPDYLETLNKFKNEFIEIEDEYIPQDELINLLQISKIVLFTYNSESVFSSGSLIETLRFSPKIIGPNKGEFNNLEQLSLIVTYDIYNNLINKIDSFLEEDETTTLYRKNNIMEYLSLNTWENFLKLIKKIVDE